MWLNTPRTAEGVSPAHILLGREPRVPGLLSILEDKDPILAGRNARVAKDRIQRQRNTGSHLNWTPIEIEIGQRVLLQDQTSKAYDIPGKVVGVRPGGRSAYIEANGGKTYLRNRRFFRIDPLYTSPALDAAKVVIVETVGSHPQSTSCFRKAIHPREAKQVRFSLPCCHEDEEGCRDTCILWSATPTGYRCCCQTTTSPHLPCHRSWSPSSAACTDQSLPSHSR